MIRRPTQAHEAGFSLIELVVVLTILAIIVSASFAGFRLVQKEIVTEASVKALTDLAGEMRARAMNEQRPYQIVFDQSGFYGLRYFHPYSDDMPVAEYVALRQEEALRVRDRITREQVERPKAVHEAPEIEGIGSTESTSAPAFEASTEIEKATETNVLDDERGSFFVRACPWPEDTTCEVLFWGELEWTPMDGIRTRRWVFQPSGLCDALQVRIRQGAAWAEIAFDPMTAELASERHGTD